MCPSSLERTQKVSQINFPGGCRGRKRDPKRAILGHLVCPPSFLVPQTTLFLLSEETGPSGDGFWGEVQRGSRHQKNQTENSKTGSQNEVRPACITIAMCGGSIPEGVGSLTSLEQVFWSGNRIDSTSTYIRCSTPWRCECIIASCVCTLTLLIPDREAILPCPVIFSATFCCRKTHVSAGWSGEFRIVSGRLFQVCRKRMILCCVFFAIANGTRRMCCNRNVTT